MNKSHVLQRFAKKSKRKKENKEKENNSVHRNKSAERLYVLKAFNFRSSSRTRTLLRRRRQLLEMFNGCFVYVCLAGYFVNKRHRRAYINNKLNSLTRQCWIISIQHLRLL